MRIKLGIGIAELAREFPIAYIDYPAVFDHHQLDICISHSRRKRSPQIWLLLSNPRESEIGRNDKNAARMGHLFHLSRTHTLNTEVDSNSHSELIHGGIGARDARA